MRQPRSSLRQREQTELDLLQLNEPQKIPFASIDSRGLRRMAVATERCTGACSGCTCVRDIQNIARNIVLTEVSFGCSGNPILTPEQLKILRARREKSVLNESTDSVDIHIEIPPAPLNPCPDSEL